MEHSHLAENVLTYKDVVDLLISRRGDKSWSEFAKEIPITRQHMSDILRGHRGVGPRVLKFLGLRRVAVATVYVLDDGIASEGKETKNGGPSRISKKRRK